MKPYLMLGLLVLLWSGPGFAQKLVDPASVSPEYRDAAEKRRAEQIRQRECAKKAEAEKVMARDRTPFLLHCLADAEAAEAAKASAPKAAEVAK